MNDVLTLSGTKAFFYSYDKNNDGEGSQFNYSKEVYYKVEIRQIKDLNGNSKIVVGKQYKILVWLKAIVTNRPFKNRKY